MILRRLPLLAAAAVALVAACGAHRHPLARSADTATAAPIPTPAAGARCHLRGHGEFTAPDPKCTPGATLHGLPLTREFVCKHRDRAPIPRSVYDKVERAYGFDPATFHGELDHLIQHSFNGADAQDYNGDGLPDNLWPEPGLIHPAGGGLNRKDTLEAYAPGGRSLYARVCFTRSMSPAQGVRADVWWRRSYRRLIGPVTTAQRAAGSVRLPGPWLLGRSSWSRRTGNA